MNTYRSREGRMYNLDKEQQMEEEAKSGITDRGLLIKSLCVLTVVIVLFLSGAIPGFKLVRPAALIFILLIPVLLFSG